MLLSVRRLSLSIVPIETWVRSEIRQSESPAVTVYMTGLWKEFACAAGGRQHTKHETSNDDSTRKRLVN